MNEEEVNKIIEVCDEVIADLKKENQELKDEINQYENPEDLTLFYMWLDAKAKDKMKELELENQKLTHIIEELEKWLEEEKDYLTEIDGQKIPLNDDFEFCSMNELYQTGKYSGLKDTLDKLKQLKEECNGTR